MYVQGCAVRASLDDFFISWNFQVNIMKTKSTYTNTIAVVSIILTTAMFSAVALASDEGNMGIESLGTAIPDAALAENRGGYDVHTSTNNLTATLEENQAISNVTGQNTVASGAFAGASGFATVVQNSGNNVIIQNSTILNLEMK